MCKLRVLIKGEKRKLQAPSARLKIIPAPLACSILYPTSNQFSFCKKRRDASSSFRKPHTSFRKVSTISCRSELKIPSLITADYQVEVRMGISRMSVFLPSHKQQATPVTFTTWLLSTVRSKMHPDIRERLYIITFIRRLSFLLSGPWALHDDLFQRWNYNIYSKYIYLK